MYKSYFLWNLKWIEKSQSSALKKKISSREKDPIDACKGKVSGFKSAFYKLMNRQPRTTKEANGPSEPWWSREECLGPRTLRQTRRSMRSLLVLEVSDPLRYPQKRKRGLEGSSASSLEDRTFHFLIAPFVYLDASWTMQGMEDLVFYRDREHLGLERFGSKMTWRLWTLE